MARSWPCTRPRSPSSARRPTAVSDAFGNVYVADTKQHRVVKLSAGGEQLGEYSTRVPSMQYPSGLALDEAGRLYVADGDNDHVVQFEAVVRETAFVTQTARARIPRGCGGRL